MHPEFPDAPNHADSPLGVIEGVDELCFSLCIVTSEPALRVLCTRFERPESRIVSLSISDVGYLSDSSGDSDLTIIPPDALKRKIAYVGDRLVLHNDNDRRPLEKAFHAPRGYLTIFELLDCIRTFESHARPLSDWFGGIDCHYTTFEGMLKRPDGAAYSILWGEARTLPK